MVTAEQVPVQKPPVVKKVPINMKKMAEKPVINVNRPEAHKLKVPTDDELKRKEGAPVWQKPMKDEGDEGGAHGVMDTEGGGDGPIEEANQNGDINIDETKPDAIQKDAEHIQDAEHIDIDKTEDAEGDDGFADDDDDDDTDEEEYETEEDAEVEYEDEEEKYIQPWLNEVAGQKRILQPVKEVQPAKQPKPEEKPKKKVPSLIMIDKQVFVEKVNTGKKFIVNLGNLGCDKCQKFYEDYRLVLHYFHDTKQKIESFLVSDKHLLEAFGFQTDEYPAVLYYRHGIPILYDGPLTATGVQSWVEDHKERATVDLTDVNFHKHVAVTNDKVTQWIVMFYDPKNTNCWRPLALAETLATRLRGKVNIGIVDITKNPTLSAKLQDHKKLPSIYLFREDDMVQLEFTKRLTLDYFNETYKEATLSLQEKLSRAAVQIKGFLMYSGGVFTVILLIFIVLCSKVARRGERQIKKGV